MLGLVITKLLSRVLRPHDESVQRVMGEEAKALSLIVVEDMQDEGEGQQWPRHRERLLSHRRNAISIQFS